MPAYAGKDGSFTYGGVTYKTKNWNLSVEFGRIDVTNMESPDSGGTTWREFIGGFASGTIRMSGVYHPNQATPTNGDSVAWTAVVGSTYQFTGNAATTRVNVSTDIEGAATLEIEGAITGAVDLNLAS